MKNENAWHVAMQEVRREVATFNPAALEPQAFREPKYNLTAVEAPFKQMPRSTIRCRHRCTIAARRSDAAFMAKLSRLVAVTYVPGNHKADFVQDVVPIRHPCILTMYNAWHGKLPLIALTGHKVIIDKEDDFVLFGGRRQSVFAKNVSLEPRHEDTAVALSVSRKGAPLSVTALAMDRAMYLVANEEAQPVPCLIPPPLLLGFPMAHTPKFEETPALWQRIFDIFAPLGPALPEWEVPQLGHVARIQGEGRSMMTITVKTDGGEHIVKCPPWCHMRAPVLVGEQVYGRLIFPPVIEAPTRWKVVQAISPAGLDWLAQRIVAASTEVMTVSELQPGEDGEMVQGIRTLRMCPYNLVPQQRRRAVGAYLDFRGMLARTLRDEYGRDVVRPQHADIHVLRLSRPPDRFGGLQFRDTTEGWALDLAGLRKEFGWLTSARDGIVA